MSTSVQQQNTSRTERFFRNVLWNWLGVAVNFVIILVLAPYIVRKLGHEAYGIWTLILGILDYYWLLDLGFGTATTKYVAHYRTTGETEKLGEVINTAFLWASVSGAILIAITFLLTQHVVGFFQISKAFQPIFSRVVTIVGVGWGLGVVFNIFNAGLYGLQRFDIVNRGWIASNVVRALGCVGALYLGFGLVGMAAAVLASQMLAYSIYFFGLRRALPELRFSRLLVRVSMMRQLFGYGIHCLVAVISDRLLTQSAPLLIGHFKPSAFVGYFGLPNRLMQYMSDIVVRASTVTSTSASELTATGDLPRIGKLASLMNRYCLVLFMPAAIALMLYGHDVIRLWIGATFADRSAPLLPVIIVGYGLAVAAQFNSNAVLYGMGRHAGYSRGLLAEAALTIATLLWVIPRYGIFGAACVTSTMMVLNRAIWASILVCRSVQYSFLAYMAAIYLRPLLAAVPAVALGVLLKRTILPGTTFFQVLAGAVIVGLSYVPAGFFLSVTAEHRESVYRVAALRLANSIPGWNMAKGR